MDGQRFSTFVGVWHGLLQCCVDRGRWTFRSRIFTSIRKSPAPDPWALPSCACFCRTFDGSTLAGSRFKHTSSNPAALYAVSGTPLCFLQLQANNQAGHRSRAVCCNPIEFLNSCQAEMIRDAKSETKISSGKSIIKESEYVYI